ncbi:MAG TPA: tetratricopeptide repeat protein [Pyrinomonadaceae bacterium]
MRNIIFGIAGAALGFLVGFYAANTISQQTPAPRAAARVGAAPASAGQLPPDHPEIGPAAGAVGGASSTVAPEAQAAADAAERSPRDFAAQLKAAETFYRLNDYRKAEQYAERAAELKPGDFKTHVLLGNSRYDRKDFTAAAEAYERALSINADDPDVRTDYGNTFFLRQPPDLDRAIAEYRKSLAVNPRHEQSWLNLASASVQKKDKQTALEALARLESVNPNNPSLPTLRQSAESLP